MKRVVFINREIVKKVIVAISLALCSFAAVLMLSVHADAADESGTGAGFSVYTVIPDNQTDTSKTYFDLQMSPGQEQTLEVRLRNDSSQMITVEAEIYSATTNTNGVVEYGKRDVELDASLTYNMQDLIAVDERIEIPANSDYVLQLELKMPEEEYEGILAGGITLKEVIESEDELEDGQMTIENKYAYVIGIVLRENDSVITPELELDEVFPNQINARNIISSRIRNIMPMYMNKLEVEAEITAKGSTEVLYRASASEMQMAPNSNFDFPVYLEGQKMKAGNYTMHLTARSMGEEWSWEKDFTITAEEANAFNQADVTIPEDDYTWIYIMAGVVVLLIAVIMILVIKSKKKTAMLKKQLNEAVGNQA